MTIKQKPVLNIEQDNNWYTVYQWLTHRKGYGEISWKTPIKQNSFEVKVSDKADLLLSVNAAALKNGASFVNSNLFQINEQKYFASTDG